MDRRIAHAITAMIIMKAATPDPVMIAACLTISVAISGPIVLVSSLSFG
jgi:hypothetical protein